MGNRESQSHPVLERYVVFGNALPQIVMLRRGLRNRLRTRTAGHGDRPRGVLSGIVRGIAAAASAEKNYFLGHHFGPPDFLAILIPVVGCESEKTALNINLLAPSAR